MKRVLHYARRFLPLAFGVAVLVYLFAFRTDPRDNINAIKGIEPQKLFMAVGLCLVSFVATAWRLRLLVSLLGHRVSLWRVFVYTLIGHLYNSAIPGGAVGGDAIKALYLSQATGSKPQAFAAVMVDRLCGLFMMAALALAVLVPLIDEPTMRQAAAVILAFAGCATVAIIALTSRRIRKLIPKGTSRKLPFSDAIRAFDEAMQVFRGHKPKGWKASQRARKGIEKIFGWLKQVGGLRRTRLKERWEPRLQALAAAATYNLLRLASLGLA